MKLKESIQRHPLTSYFVLAYGVPWVCILALLATKGFRLAVVQPADASLMILFQLLGPSIAGLLLTAMLEGRAGLRGLRQRFTRWQVAWPWYGVALLAVPLLTLAILSALSTWLGPGYAPRGQFIGLGLGLLAGAFEETGWTGFATPRLLQRFSPLKTGLLLGFLWAGWHGLADFSGNFAAMGALWPVWFVLFWIIPLTAYRFLMTWVYTHTHSLLLAVLMHASYTGWLITLSPELETAPGLLWQGLFAAALVLIAAGVAYRHRRQWLAKWPLSVVRSA